MFPCDGLTQLWIDVYPGLKVGGEYCKPFLIIGVLLPVWRSTLGTFISPCPILKNEKNLKEERIPPGDSIRRAWENYLVIKNPFHEALTDSFPRVVCHSHGGWSQKQVRGQTSLISRSLPSLREYKEYTRVSTHRNES